MHLVFWWILIVQSVWIKNNFNKSILKLVFYCKLILIFINLGILTLINVIEKLQKFLKNISVWKDFFSKLAFFSKPLYS